MKDIITEVRMWPVKSSSKAVASGYFVMGGKVKVKCAIIKSKKDDGLFVVLPYHSDENGNKFNDVEGTNAENTKALKAHVIAVYQAANSEANQFDQTKDDAEGEEPWG
jgi:DNA-binding cell septation regulator SpoVG